jgi:hypothetical protein
VPLKAAWGCTVDVFLPTDQSLEQLGVGPLDAVVLKRISAVDDFRVSLAEPQLLRHVYHQVSCPPCSDRPALYTAWHTQTLTEA